MTSIEDEDEDGYYQRLRCTLACSWCAVHLFEYVSPGDARLRFAVELVARSIDGHASNTSSIDEHNNLHTAMWEAEKARSGDDEGNIISLAADAVVLLCRSELGRLESEPRDDLEIEMYQSCWYAAQAVERAFEAKQEATVPVIPISAITREDIRALSQAFLLWLDYWDNRRAASDIAPLP